MDSKALCLVVVAAFLICAPAANAFNITRLLGNYPNFSTFNDLLTQTKLYEQINRRQTITILVVDNSAIGSITGKPLDLVKRILSTHVILDYYDLTKIHGLSKRSTLLTTLYQASGVADNMQGFLNLTKTAPGEIHFGSGMKGASLNSNFVQQVATQPYNISVLQVTSIIDTPGMEGIDMGSSPASPPPPPMADTPTKAPAPSVAEAPAEVVVATPAEAPAEVVADGPVADGPAVSPSPSEPADAKEPTKSSSTRVISSVGFIAGFGLLSLSLW